jgi:ribosomal-protein-alanine N-acetyltransferase
MLDEIAQIARRSFTNPWTREMFENELTKNPFSDQILAMADGKVAGYLFAMALFEECHLLDFAVDPDFRRQGIGEKMLGYLIGKMLIRNIRKIFLEVRSSNIAAQALYQKAGFRRIALRKAYYANPVEDAVIYQWSAPDEKSSGTRTFHVQ